MTKLVCEMVARDLHPVSMVKGNGFRQLINFLEPGYQIPSHTHVTTVCSCMHQVGRERVAAKLCDRYVVLTSDIWTSVLTQSYITITVHFISDNWEL